MDHSVAIGTHRSEVLHRIDLALPMRRSERLQVMYNDKAGGVFSIDTLEGHSAAEALGTVVMQASSAGPGIALWLRQADFLETAFIERLY
ncbi:MAG: hypothetical protein F9K16_00255 [Thermoanaerobaculia bacterium]|nr:MAG: hypothetical protein F9K16_00255 [Thermoanaerobaculia bacterium]MBZ0103413.1 hypothetical protein [Thermoanaerobaculia bacterium]